jgi:hypothetical protein
MFFSIVRDSRKKFLKNRMAVVVEDVSTLMKSTEVDFSSKRQRTKKKCKVDAYRNMTSSSLISHEERFIPITVDYSGEMVNIEYELTRENQGSGFFLKTIDRIYTVFKSVATEVLPSFFDISQSIRESNGKGEITMNITGFRAIQMFNYTLHLISLAKPKSTGRDISQYPFLLQMYIGRKSPLEKQRLTCFAKIMREWVISSIELALNKNVFRESASERLTQTLSEDQMVLVRSLHKLLHVITIYHKGDCAAFLRFLNVQEIGMFIIYNFLFMSSIDKIHWRAIEELNDLFSALPDRHDDDNTHSLRARHSALVSTIPKLRGLKCDVDGYIDISPAAEKYGINPVALKIQIYTLICDSRMNANVSMAILCYLTSSTLLPLRNRELTLFGETVITAFSRSLKDQDTRRRIREIYETVSFSFDKKDILRIKSSLSDPAFSEIALVTDDYKPPLGFKGENKPERQPLIHYVEYLNMIKQGPVEGNIFFSSYMKTENPNLIGLSLFLSEMDRRIVTKSRSSPKIEWKNYVNPEIQFPLSLNSQKDCIYMDEVFLDIR